MPNTAVYRITGLFTHSRPLTGPLRTDGSGIHAFTNWKDFCLQIIKRWVNWVKSSSSCVKTSIFSKYASYLTFIWNFYLAYKCIFGVNLTHFLNFLFCIWFRKVNISLRIFGKKSNTILCVQIKQDINKKLHVFSTNLIFSEFLKQKISFTCISKKKSAKKREFIQKIFAKWP